MLTVVLVVAGATPAVAAQDPLVTYYFLGNQLVNGGLSTNGTTTEFHYSPTWYFNTYGTAGTRIMTDADGWASLPISASSAVATPYTNFSVMGGAGLWSIGGFDVKNSGSSTIDITVTSTPSGGTQQVDVFSIAPGIHTVTLSGHSPQASWQTVVVSFASTTDLSFNHVSLATYTQDVAPTVISGLTSSVTNNTASMGGSVTWDGGTAITARGICYSTSASAVSVADSKVAVSADAGTYTANLTGLNAGTTYYARAYATNSAGTSYGDIVSFTTTGSSAPTRSVPAASLWSLALAGAAGIWILAVVRRRQLRTGSRG